MKLLSASLLLPTAFALVLHPIHVHDEPVIHPRSFPIKSFLNFGKTIEPHALVKADRARIHNMIQRAMREPDDVALNARAPVSVEATNVATGYTMNLAIGDPPTEYEVMIDTGSSNTWIGNIKPYVETETSHKTKNNVSVSYGSGEMMGVEYLDQVSLGPNLTITNQSIGVATSSQGFPTDGLLGLGPFALTIGTLFPEVALGVHTVTENLASQGHISKNVLGVSFQPTNNITAKNGALTFGAPDPSQYVGKIRYVDIPKFGAASRFWGFKQTVEYGDTTILNNKAGFLDTGATLLLFNTTAFHKYQEATGGVLDDKVGLLRITDEQYKNLKPLVFNVNGTKFELVPDAQLWPKALNTFIGGDENSTYLIASDLGEIPGAPDLEFVCGYTFLERFYTVYDGAKKRIGIANTKFSNITIN